MSTTELIDMIKQLPADKQKEVEDFVDILLAKTKNEVHSVSNNDIKAGFGSMKGLIKYMAKDFDEPLEDFKDYM